MNETEPRPGPPPANASVPASVHPVHPVTPSPRHPVTVSWFVLAAGAAATLYGLVCYWLTDHYSIDRMLIFAAAGWAAWKRWPFAVVAAGTPRPVVGLAALVVAAALFLPAWFVFVQLGPRAIVFWIETAAVLVAAAGLVVLRHGWGTLFALRFPLLFPFLGLPLPGRINTLAHGSLQGVTTDLATAALRLGYPVKQDGNVLTLPHGVLGVVEACSGLQSMTALTAIAAFLAFVRGFGPGKWLSTMAFAVPVIVLANAARVVGTGVLQEQIGADAILGWRHDALGFAAVLAGLGLIAGFTRLIGGPMPAAPAAPPLPPARPGTIGDTLAAAWLGLTAIVAVAAGFAPGLTVTAPTPPAFDDIPPTLGGWRLAETSAEPDVAVPLGTDTLRHHIYRRVGADAHVWLMHWTSANGVNDYHHPDTCWPNRGWAQAVRRVEPHTTPGGRRIGLTYREFQHGADRQIVVYWTQEGRRIWTDADEAAAISPLFPVHWVRRRVTDPASTTADDRLAVLVAMDTWTGAAVGRAELLDLTGRVADAVYDGSPWADPLRDGPDRTVGR